MTRRGRRSLLLWLVWLAIVGFATWTCDSWADRIGVLICAAVVTFVVRWVFTRDASNDPPWE